MSESSTTPPFSEAAPDPSNLGAWVLGRIGYEAYGQHPGAHGPWTTFDGRPMPTWPELQQGDAGQLTRDRWAAAALAIANEIEQRRRAYWAKAEEDTGQVAPSKRAITVNVPELKVDASDLDPRLERLEGLVNQLSTAPVSMSDLCHGARALAEASAFLSTSDSDASKAVSALVQDMAKCLSAQVRELTPPSEA